MKTSKCIYSLLIAVSGIILCGFAVVLSSCDGGGGVEPELTAGEKALINLATSPWKVTSVMVDGVDKTSLFTGFSITFTSSANTNGKPTGFSGTYTTTNGGPVWTNSTWTISDAATASSFQRGDGITVQLTDITASALKMSLTWDKNTFGSGRVESIKGQHVFTMGK